MTYTANIMNDETATDLETVDLRDISTERLRALIVEAGQAGDADMVATCEAVIASR